MFNRVVNYSERRCKFYFEKFLLVSKTNFCIMLCNFINVVIQGVPKLQDRCSYFSFYLVVSLVSFTIYHAVYVLSASLRLVTTFTLPPRLLLKVVKLAKNVLTVEIVSSSDARDFYIYYFYQILQFICYSANDTSKQLIDLYTLKQFS